MSYNVDDCFLDTSLSDFSYEQRRLTLINTSKILVLDLDETLVHCRGELFEAADAMAMLPVEGTNRKIYISERPGLKKFLREMAKNYILILFTSGTKEYANLVLTTLKIQNYFYIVLHRDDCELTSEGNYEKNLNGLGFPLSEVVLIDDSLTHVKNQPDNILTIRPYRGEPDDKELSIISEFLEKLANESDVRPVMRKLVYYQFPGGFSNPTKRASEIEKDKEISEVSLMKTTRTVPKTEREFGGIDENEGGINITDKLSKLGWERSTTQTFKSIAAKIQDRFSGHVEKFMPKEGCYARNIWESEIIPDYKTPRTQPCQLETDTDFFSELSDENGLGSIPPVIEIKLHSLKMKPATVTTGK